MRLGAYLTVGKSPLGLAPPSLLTFASGHDDQEVVRGRLQGATQQVSSVRIGSAGASVFTGRRSDEGDG